MKILIISLPRTGSTSLTHKLSKIHNLEIINEPYRTTNIENEFKPKKENIIVKSLVHHHRDNFELVKYFNKENIILLSRKDLVSCAESYVYLIKNFEKNRFGFKSEYFYENIRKDDFDYYYQIINEYHNQLKNLSEKLEIPITFYEDIFDPNSEDRLRKFEKNNLNRKLI